MSSPYRHFFAGLACSALLALLMGWVSLMVDPTTAAADVWPGKPQWCQAGVRTDWWRAQRGLIARVQPREVLLGSSRMQSTFSREVAEAQLRLPVMNLGTSGADLVALELPLRAAAESGRLQRAWVGLDFGMFSYARPDDEYLSLQQFEANGLADMFSAESSWASVSALMDPVGCTHPQHDLHGFEWVDRRIEDIARKGWLRNFEWSKVSVLSNFRIAAHGHVETRQQASQRQWLALQRMLLLAKEHRFELVLVINPSHRDYREVIASAGLAAEYEMWRRELGAWSRSAGIALFDWSDYRYTLETDNAECAARPEGCPMYDINHATPAVGAAMLRRMLPPGHVGVRLMR